MIKPILRKFLSQQFINDYFHLPMAFLANIFYGFPTKGLTIIGVTGTDGKTTTTNMVYQILKTAGKKVSMVSSINAVIANRSYDTGFHVTSPDPWMVQRFAKQAKDHKDEYLVLEVTSHALDQYRFWGIKFDVGVITNVTHEHLDYHKSFQNYFKTKLKLLKDVKFAVVNTKVKDFKEFRGIIGKIITFGLKSGDFNQKQISLKLKIPGDYNIENALASLGVAFALGVDKKIALKALEGFIGVAGRMEEINNQKGIKVIIDFAHTPNALEQALKTLKNTSSGRLVAVFGCAGKRDESKRGAMGRIAAKMSDFAVITAEDPRGELDSINKQILEGAITAGGVLDKNIFVIPDRAEAIGFAINKLAKKGDTVGIFGKGHEASMNLDGKKELPWSDKKAVETALK